LQEIIYNSESLIFVGTYFNLLSVYTIVKQHSQLQIAQKNQWKFPSSITSLVHYEFAKPKFAPDTDTKRELKKKPSATPGFSKFGIFINKPPAEEKILILVVALLAA